MGAAIVVVYEISTCRLTEKRGFGGVILGLLILGCGFKFEQLRSPGIPVLYGWDSCMIKNLSSF